ncbi:MAG: AI-2E family transporter [Acidobacteria bacterium]|nr:AI-2E family transporter [Acidobacteriota bacterium]
MKRPDPAILRLIVFLGGLVALLALLIAFRKVFLPLLLGLLVAYLLDPAVTWFERHRRSRLFGVVVITAALALTLVMVAVFLIPALGHQLERLADRLPEYQRQMRSQLEPLFARVEARYPAEIENFQTRAVEGIRENFFKLAGSIGRAVKGVFTNLFGFVLALLNFVFVPVFAFYLLVDLPKLKQALLALVPIAYQEVVVARVSEVDRAISSFVRGQLVIALILAAINATGLMLLDVPFGLGIGLIAGLANMIPYMALVVGLAPALALAWAEHQEVIRLLGVVAVFGGAQALEGMFLSPRILGRSVNLHPVWVLLSIIAGGSFFGFVGMLAAVPVAASIQVFARHWLEIYRNSAVYKGAPSKVVPPDGTGDSVDLR